MELLKILVDYVRTTKLGNVPSFPLSHVLPYALAKQYDHFLKATISHWDTCNHTFTFTGTSLCPTIEEFGAILGFNDLDQIVVLTCRVASKQDL